MLISSFGNFQEASLLNVTNQSCELFTPSEVQVEKFFSDVFEIFFSLWV